jgi:hypothetical protein
MSVESEVDLRLFHIGSKLAEGVTDPATITDALVRSALRSFSRADLLSLAVGEVGATARSLVRGRNAEIERRATALRQREEDARPKQPTNPEGNLVPKGQLVRDFSRYRHGSWAKKDGAARRGCPCERCVPVREVEQESNRRLYKSLGDIVREYTTEVRMEWDAELLELSFAVDHSGHTVTWGAATVDQHQSRIEMLIGNALANTEAAGRHQVAIDDIERAGAVCLSDVVGSKAA